MGKEKKSVGRWIGEAVLIFLSVLGAFYFENFRESQNQKRVYLNYLNDLRSDLTLDQLRYQKELADSFDVVWGNNYLGGRLQHLNTLDSMLSSPNVFSTQAIIDIIGSGAIDEVSKWIFQSPQLEKLNGEYHSLIEMDTLKRRLRIHISNNETRFNLKDKINAEVVYLHRSAINSLDLDTPSASGNRRILFRSETKNQVRKLRELVQRLYNVTVFGSSNDQLLIQEIDKELALHD